MRIRQKLLASFLFVSILTLGVSYGIGLLVQEETVATFQEVGGEILPGNIALARMTAELYRTLVLLDKYEENPGDQIREEIAKALSSLASHETMHDLFHTDEQLPVEVEQLVQDFSRSVVQYLLLQQKNASQQEMQATRHKIDLLLDQFTSSINPHIEEEFAASYQKIANVQKKGLQARRILLAVGIAILVFAIVLSLFIANLLSKPLRALRDAAKQIGAGRLDLTLPVTSQDEIGELAQAFNDMSGNLATMRTELVSAKEYIDNIIASMVDALIVVSPAGVIETVNAATVRLLGYAEEELVGQPLTRIFDNEVLPAADLAVLAEKEATRGLNVDFRSCGGEIVTMSLSGSAMHDQAGEIQAIILVAHDIRELTRLVAELNAANLQLKEEVADRTEAERALADEKERLAVTLRSIGDGVITSDIQGRVVLINKVAETLTGWTQAEAMGQPFSEVFHIINQKTRRPCTNPVEKVLTTGQIIGLANHTVLIAKDGSERSVADSAAPIHDRESRVIGVVLVFRDVTEEERLEQELLKVKKLESIGVLAGGIAHDFNNILAAILGNIDLAMNFVDPEEKIYPLLSEAGKASLRAKDLTQQLLTFSKGGEPVKKRASISDIIQESSQFVLRGSNVRCIYHFAEDLWPVVIDSGQISQVIQNIILNADQAMPEGGTIEVDCENVLAPSAALLAPKLASPCIKITIRDHGAGIAADHLDKIFDPYFSTTSTGSGLGLAITHSIIMKHDGHISVESVLGEGATFTILLPATEERTRIAPRSHPEVPMAAGNERVLIMDDDEMVLEMSRMMLNELGYEAVTTKDGTEAIEVYKKALADGRPFDIMLMDLTIPGGVGGKEAAREILALDSGARMIASSGYSNDPVIAKPAEYGFVGAINKPYKLGDLASTVAAALRSEKT